LLIFRRVLQLVSQLFLRRDDAVFIRVAHVVNFEELEELEVLEELEELELLLVLWVDEDEAGFAPPPAGMRASGFVRTTLAALP